ncbi:MAG TPA: FAD-dependent oxidoreductase [Bosea sp. (in: a-proteobacteria)]|jgi:NADPH-dependent 2,4-dienoyl-CoA reductase/sulfur reductase-like enzyme|nr:FAD-dependent oxidoreductase [Bosea sp. (in: a-proteobacteria)]
MTAQRTIIAGASAAGWLTAEALRRHQYQGEIVLIGDEPSYERPPLSKQVLSGDWHADRTALFSTERQDKIGAKLLLGRASALDVGQRTIKVEHGETIAFDHAVIATGVRPRTLPGTDVKGFHVLRTIGDALALREKMSRQGDIIIFGAGFIGMEVAATARRLGIGAIVIDPVFEPLRLRLGAAVASRLYARHRAEGVEFRFGLSLAAISTRAGEDGAPRLKAVSLSDGSVLATEVALVAIGCQPNVEWLSGSGLTIDDGVGCDDFCMAAEGIWAAGDVARWRHRGFGVDMRIEHRTNAAEQGDTVARNIMGQAKPYLPVPFFWSDQFDIRLQVAGRVLEDAEARVEHGDIDGSSFVVSYRADGRLSGVVGWNAGKAVTEFRRELLAQLSPQT